ncbi:hypothetical protein EET67_04910 [Pseudaminobacter arsenicus]|uniref:Uncharacterized protein n=1 Tax=Borborobacter arsenicus TaxID=1851146 RepID=A0A432VA11_9HYPH|nr:hypothetical protein [Pseudaminobacter arsenicus]RUM98984.1 hypothetical protein EET67_04910 [Pseudaminobacter arsenicus]
MPTTITIDGYNHAVLTADEFIAQGTAPGAIMSIAEHLSASGHDHVPQPLLAAEVRSVAREVAYRTGQSLQVPGSAVNARQFASYKRRHAMKGANDNRSAKAHGKPRNRRAA